MSGFGLKDESGKILGISWGLNREMSSILNSIKWIQMERAGLEVLQNAKHLAFAAAVNHIWKARDELIFKQKPFNIDCVVYRIKYMVLFSMFPEETVVAILPCG